MYRSLAEAAANCTRNLQTGYGPVISDWQGPVIQSDETLPEGAIAQYENELIANLKDPRFAARVGAVCALAELGPLAVNAVPALIDALEDADWMIRVGAITALGEIGEPACGAVPALIDALDHDDVRGSAAIALGRIGPEALCAVEALEKYRHSENPFVKWCVNEALNAIHSETAASILAS